MGGTERRNGFQIDTTSATATTVQLPALILPFPTGDLTVPPSPPGTCIRAVSGRIFHSDRQHFDLCAFITGWSKLPVCIKDFLVTVVIVIVVVIAVDGAGRRNETSDGTKRIVSDAVAVISVVAVAVAAFCTCDEQQRLLLAL
jgi:hypothetical protein